jgi:quercetin dioxygenase-like cupin family protein
VRVVDWDGVPKESWGAGTETRLHASARSGSERLCVGEQWFDPGSGTPVARHAPEVEEVISVLHGAARVRVNDETQIIRAGQSVIIPGGATHQLTAIENVPLHVWFVLSASAPEVFLVDEPGESFTIGGPNSERRPI